MKKLGFLASTITMVLIFSLLLASCQRLNKDDVLSNIGSSEITSSDTATSEPENEKELESSKPENSSKPQVSSKPKESSKPSVSSKPKPSVSSKANKPEPNPLDYKTPNELILGKWKSNVDIVPKLAEEGYKIEGSAYVNVTFEFLKGGIALYTIDKTSFSSAMKSVLNQALQSELTANNLTQQEFEAQISMTIDEYVNSVIESMIDSATTYVYYYMFDWGDNELELNIGTEENTYTGYHFEFKTVDKLIIKEYGQFVTYTRVK